MCFTLHINVNCVPKVKQQPFSFSLLFSHDNSEATEHNNMKFRFDKHSEIIVELHMIVGLKIICKIKILRTQFLP